MSQSRNKYPLTTQTTKLFIVIRKNKPIPFDLIQAYCEERLEKYAWIEHTADIEPVTKVVEGVHYHIVGVAKKKKTPLKTHLNDLVEFFRFEDSNGIQIDKYDNEVSALQYLIHKNNPEKTQHNAKEITTNYDKQEFALILGAQQQEVISFDMVYSLCCECKSITEVIRAIGFKTYAKYRNTIQDMWKDRINL